MKRTVTIFIFGVIVLSLMSCNTPFDESKCIIEGTIYPSANPCMSAICEPGMGLWIETKDQSYVIDGYWYSTPEEFSVGETIARWGDYIKVYGTSRSYREANGKKFNEISIDSLVVLIARENRRDTIEGTISGTVHIFPPHTIAPADTTDYYDEDYYDGNVYIDGYLLTKDCYTANSDFTCVTILGLELCKHGPGDNRNYDYVEARGTIYRTYDEYGFKREKISISHINLLEP